MTPGQQVDRALTASLRAAGRLGSLVVKRRLSRAELLAADELLGEARALIASALSGGGEEE